MLVLIALTMMAVDYRSPSFTEPVRRIFSIIGYPLQRMVDAPFSAYNFMESFFADQEKLLRENERLKEDLLLFSVKNREMQSIQQENDRLRELLKADKRPGYTFTMAEILSVSGNRRQNVVTLNKGKRDGVFVKQVVVAAGGSIFGQVIEVAPFHSKVMLITDAQHAIPVRNQRSSPVDNSVKQALASGTGESDLMELKSMELQGSTKANDVREGDLFLSSGQDGLFPKDFPVAVVVPNGVKYVPGDPLANIKARPVADVEDTREVLLLWRKMRSDVVDNVEQAAKTETAPPAQEAGAEAVTSADTQRVQQ